jgi:hypothetical protein
LTRHKGFEVYINSKCINFNQNGTILFSASIQPNNSALLDGTTEPISEYANIVSTLPLDINLWHRRFAHHNYADIQKMIKEELVTGLVLDTKQQPDPICEPCLSGKMHSNPFPTSPSHSSQPLELIHTDLHGPLPVPTPEGYRYWIIFIDDCKKFRVGVLLKQKSDAFNAFKWFKAYAENQLNCKIKAMQDDKAGEYMSKAFTEFTDNCGIIHRHTTCNRPQMNGVAERANRTISDDITAMIAESNLPPSFWGLCFAAHLHVWNRLPTAPLPHTTPYEGWFKRKPDVSHLRVWGCTAYVYIQRDKRKSLESHMEKCIFVGYPTGYKGWKFYNPTTKKYIICERAEFDERYFPGLSVGTLPKINLQVPSSPTINSAPLPDLGGDDEPPPIQTLPVQLPNPLPVPQPSPSPPIIPEEHHIQPRRSTRISKPPGEWWKVRTPAPILESDDEDEDELEDVQFAGVAAGDEFRNYKQAMKSNDAERWTEATTAEHMTLLQNGTWTIVELPPGKKAIGSGWVFRIKRNADGSIERYKARIVAKGFSQRPGIDFTEVFAPTFRPSTLRLILALAATHDLELRSLDVSSAFTNGDLDEEIYMIQPEGFHQGGPNMVCKLNKSLYGLKQSARQWNKKLHAALSDMNFIRIESDRSVYIYSNKEVKIIVPIYIDDITFASKSIPAIEKAMDQLAQHFKCRILGPTDYLLGVGITRDRKSHTIQLHQRQFILDILERYGMSDCHSVLTPMTPGMVLTKQMSPQTPEEVQFMQNVPYLSAIGSLQYLATMTRPDIAYTVSYLARFNSNPGPNHWAAVKHLLRYCKGTLDYKLTYGGEANSNSFTTYSDSAHGDCKDTGRSTSGYVTMFAGGAIGWSSKVQGIVTLSTTEAEYVSAVEAGKEIYWMRNILREFGYQVSGPSILYVDNQSAISVSKNPEHHGRMKHLDLRYYWLRDAVENGYITPNYIPTAKQIADLLTKPLAAPKVQFCRDGMGIKP